MLKKILNKKDRILAAFLLTAIFMLLFACGNSHRVKKIDKYLLNLKESVDQAKVETQEYSIQLPTPITYKATELRMPFSSPQAFTGNKESGSTNPLLVYPVSMLRFVGTLSKNSMTVAYVIAPDSKVYQIKVGDLIGNNHGKIIHIYPDRLEVMELNVNPGKPTTQRIVTLQLQDELK